MDHGDHDGNGDRAGSPDAPGGGRPGGGQRGDGRPGNGRPGNGRPAGPPGGPLDTAERPFVLVWELTQACDLTCDHCRADAQPDRHPNELSTEEGETLLDSAAEFADGQLVVFSGGDPIKRDDVVHLVRYGTERGLQITLTPSGTASLTADRVEALADAGLRRLALSIDGPDAERHDAFRGEAGSFERTVEAAEAVREADLPLQINTTVCADTVDGLREVADLVEQLDAVLWAVFFLVPVGRGTALEPVSPGKSEAIMEWLCELDGSANFGIKTTEAPHYRRVAIQRERRADGVAPSPEPGGNGRDGIGRRMGIRAGDGFAFVSHVGQLFPSGFLPLSAGDVRDGSLVERYRESPLFRHLRQTDRLRGKCGACEFREVCGGSRSRAFAVESDPMASDPLCPYVPAGYDGPLPASWPDPTVGRPADD